MSTHFRKLPPDFDWSLYIQYLLGVCPTDKRDLVAGWIKQSAETREIKAGIWAGVSPEARESRARIISAVKKTTHGCVEAVIAPSKGIKQTPSFRHLSWIAPALLLMMTVPWVWRESKDLFSIQYDSKGAGIMYTTRRAQRATVTLKDGTRVILGPDTRLQVATDFGKSNRTVTLTGQAYFNVTHTADVSFTVRTENSITRVLGTVFVVRAYSTDRTPQVAVAEGKVGFGHKAPDIILVSGDVGRLKSDSSPVVERETRITDAFGWTRGQISFDNTLLRDAIPELERTYDIRIQLPDTAFASMHVTAQLTDRSVTDMLETLLPPLGATYKIRGNLVTITRR